MSSVTELSQLQSMLPMNLHCDSW